MVKRMDQSIDEAPKWPFSVLVVEDEAVNRRMLSTILGRLVAEVREAANGVEAMNRCLERLPDVLITDLSMPELDGRGLLDELGRRGFHIPTIVLTAHNDFDPRGLGPQECQVLFKPLRISRLTELLAHFARSGNFNGRSEAGPPEPSDE